MPNSPVALVTGASSGIGRETAVQLAAAGYRTALVARRTDELQATARRIADEAGSGAETLCLPADLGDTDRLHELVDRAVEAFGRLDVLANVAGDAPLQPIDEISPAIWRQCIDINLSATVLLTAAAWPHFKRQQAGFVANVSSMASIDPFPGFSAYAAAKIGVNMFTQCTADEGESLGVKAVAVAPGAVETPALRRNFGPEVMPAEKTLASAEVAAVLCGCILGQREFTSGETIVLESP